MTADRRPLRRVLGLVPLAAAVGWAAVEAWNTQNHSARVAIGWGAAALMVLVATWTDLRSLRRPRAALVVTTAWLYVVGLTTLLVIAFGGVASGVGIAIGIPATALAWTARHRTAGRHVDGPLLAVLMLAATGATALSRPWTPTSGEWAWGAGIAFAAAAIALTDVAMISRRACSDCGRTSPQ